MNNFGAFQTQPGIPPGMHMNMAGLQFSPFKTLSDEQLLEQFKSMAVYGDHNPTTLLLIAELYHRTQQAFGKTFIPTKEVHGDAHLYTSIYKNGVMTHFFVGDNETKNMIQSATVRAWKNDGLLTPEGVQTLLDLGNVFTAVTVDDYGKQIGEVTRLGFAHLMGIGFNICSEHSSKTLPMGVIEFSFRSPAGISRGTLSDGLLETAKRITDDKGNWAVVQDYLKSVDVLEEYKKSVESVFGAESTVNSLSPIPVVTQIHFFPADKRGAPIKFLSGKCGGPRPEGFVDRNKYPSLFINEQGGHNPNAFNSGSMFGGPGQPGGPSNF